MHPNVDESPLHASYLRPGMVVFDTVYTPETTMLIREAKTRDAHVITGVELFIRQAGAQFKLFTGAEPPLDVMGQVLRRRCRRSRSMTTNDRIYLIGPRGSGKTTVGRLLADRLGWTFVDADDVLEADCGRSIADIFAAEGESGFRAREARVIQGLVRLRQTVVACGGGAVLRPENRDVLRSTGRCVWLTGDPATLCRRIQSDPMTATRRPALTELPGPGEIELVVSEREPLYREVAHLTVATDGRSPDAIVSTILSAWSTLPSTCP